MFSWKITPKGLFTFLAQCQHLECFPQNFPKNPFFYRNLGKIGLLCNFYTIFSFKANILVIISSILGYLAVKGLIKKRQK